MGSGIVALSTTDGLEEAGLDARDLHAEVLHLGGDRVAERAERVLGGRVRRREGHAVHAAGDRRHVDDRALAPLAHRRQHRPGTPERTQEVRGDDRLPGLVGALLDRGAGAAEAGVVDEHVDLALALEHLADARPHVGVVVDVELEHLGVEALVARAPWPGRPCRGCACVAYTRSPRRPNASAAW